MAYEPTVWKTGDIVSSERLNKIENGIANAGGGSFDLSDRIAKGEGEGATIVGSVTVNEEDAGYGMVPNVAPGQAAFAEGISTEATGAFSHAEGRKSKASGSASHAEGAGAKASGNFSHAEGSGATASGNDSHAEGSGTTASGNDSHAEGSGTTASGSTSHAEGSSTTASGGSSHAEGSNTTASGRASHAEGFMTIAKGLSQHVFGFGNVEDPYTGSSDDKSTYIEIVGNGKSAGFDLERSNARTLDWSGNEKLAGSLTLGMGTSDEITITPAQLKKLIDMIPIS